MKTTIPIFRHVLQILPFQVAFLMFYSYALLVWLFFQCVALSIEGINQVIEILYIGVKLSFPMISQLNGCFHFLCVSLLIFSYG